MNDQFKKGALELCVLAQLNQGDKYGYQLTASIGSQLDLANGTLYLILRRLHQDNYVETYLQESTAGPVRKYYHLTAAGKQYMTDMKDEWLDFTGRVEKLL